MSIVHAHDVFVCIAYTIAYCHLGFYDQIREYIPFFIWRRFIFLFLFPFFSSASLSLSLSASLFVFLWLGQFRYWLLPFFGSIGKIEIVLSAQMSDALSIRSHQQHWKNGQWRPVRGTYGYEPMSCVMPKNDVCVCPLSFTLRLRLLSTSPSSRTVCVYSFVAFFHSFRFVMCAMFFVCLLGQRVIENDTCSEAKSKWVFVICLDQIRFLYFRVAQRRPIGDNTHYTHTHTHTHISCSSPFFLYLLF